MREVYNEACVEIMFANSVCNLGVSSLHIAVIYASKLTPVKLMKQVKYWITVGVIWCVS